MELIVLPQPTPRSYSLQFVGVGDNFNATYTADSGTETTMSILQPNSNLQAAFDASGSNANATQPLPLDQFLEWIDSSETRRPQLLRQLFESLESPLEGLSDRGLTSGDEISDKMLDLFWKRLGQSLTGFPNGRHRIREPES